MIYKILRVVRVVVAICVLLAFVAYFVDFTDFSHLLDKLRGSESDGLADAAGKVLGNLSVLAKLQFIPALLAGSFIVFGVLVAATLIFGRLYCSVICPLGILQDAIAWVGRLVARYLPQRDKKAKTAASADAKPDAPKPRKRKAWRNYEYRKNPVAWRVAFLIFAILSTVLGGLYFGLIEPYGVFGRIALNVFKPVNVAINNALYSYYTARDVHDYYYYDLRPESIGALVTGVLSFVVLCVFAGRWGRLYCNSVCPVGTILGFLSRYSFFRTRIDASKCVKCGLCSKRCKSSCIDFKNKTVDASRCVVCLDCFTACKKDALYYGPSRKSAATGEEAEKQNLAAQKERVLREVENFDRGKRDFITLSLAATTAAISNVALAGDYVFLGEEDDAPAKPKAADYAADESADTLEEAKPDDYGLTPYERKYTISPPGSVSHKHFSSRCVGCHLCVAKCPARIIKPSGLENGLKGFMQPHLDFTYGFCNYDCTICGEVCPAGAILPMKRADKQLVQTGHVVFIKENCIVYAQETSCGACSEHCPTQALRMVPYKGTLTIPETDVELCVGCGGCEHICPARPFRAVYIEGNPEHVQAKPVERVETKQVEEVDFGF